MSLEFIVRDVVATQDGPYECYDAVFTAAEIERLWKTGFLKPDPERQRGEDTVTRKPVLDTDKVDKWADQLLNTEAYLGQLSWNFRKDETSLQHDAPNRTLTIGPGAASIPDSVHRHMAIVKAVESAERGSGFDLNRKFSVRIYHAPATEENRIFYAMNQEGQKADPTRSKWLHRVGVTKLAAAVVERSPHLRDNVDTVRDRISKRNSRLCAFNTLSRAFEDHWSDINPGDDATFQSDVEYLLHFWDKLASVRPELGKLDLARRQKVREALLADSALAITAYVSLARKMREQGVGLAALEKLTQNISLNGRLLDYFSRDNPLWEKTGVLVPVTKRDGTKALHLRNAKESRNAMLQALEDLIGLSSNTAAARAAVLPSAGTEL